MPITITREMTITHDDFFRLLPKALRGHEFSVDGSEIRVDTANGGNVLIELSAESRRRLGSFSLPVTRVEARFRGMTEQSVREFLTVFERTYQRGGG